MESFKKTERLLSLIMAVMLCALVVSCGEDSEDNKGNEASIVGTWVRGTTTLVLGGNGSYDLTDNSIPDIPQYRKGTYSYNSSQKLLVVNVVAIPNQNNAYSKTYIVQTLTKTNLVLLYTDGDVEGYYSRK